MRTHEHVELAFSKGRKRALLLPGRAETAKDLDLHAKRGEALEEGLVVLLGQNRRWAEHHNLPAAVHAFERRAQSDLGLSEAHVAAEQPVHGFGRLHIRLDVGDGI